MGSPSRLPPPADSAPRATVAYRRWAEVGAWWPERPHEAQRALEHARAGAHLLRALVLEGQVAALPAAVSALAEAAVQARAEPAMSHLSETLAEVSGCLVNAAGEVIPTLEALAPSWLLPTMPLAALTSWGSQRWWRWSKYCWPQASLRWRIKSWGR